MSVSIIGCGWLGQALATALLKENISVLASYQSQSTLAKLNSLNIPATQLTLPLARGKSTRENVNDFLAVDRRLFASEVLVIAIPPQIKKGKVDYPLKIEQLVTLAEQGQTKHIILLNSTAIYNGLVGAIDEASSLDISAAKVETLLAAERAVKKFSKQVHILRLAGLVGPNRHPGKFLQSGRVFTHASAQVNLVHQTDVVNIIKLLIKNNSPELAVIYNVVSHTKVDRKGYYQAAAKALGLALPCFETEQEKQPSKQVVGDKVRAELQYSFVHDDLLQWALAL